MVRSDNDVERTGARIGRDPGLTEDPPVTQRLFNRAVAVWGWRAVRLSVGDQWVTAGEHKVSDTAWMTTSEALNDVWVRAAAIPASPATPVVSFDWYRDFLQYSLDTQA